MLFIEFFPFFLVFMDSDLFRALGCFAVAGVLLAAPVWVPAWAEVADEAVGPSSPDMRTMSGYAEADALRSYEHPEDVWCSGASPDCPSHFEAWNEPVCNSLPPTY